MSEHPSEEQPLTAAAFASPAASRRDMTARVIRAVPTDLEPEPEPEVANPELSARESPPPAEPRTAGPVQPTAPAQQPSYGPPTGQPWQQTAPPAGPYGYPQQPGTQYAPGGASGHLHNPAYAQMSAPAADDPAYGFEQFNEAARQAAPVSPASWGWRGRVRKLTGGLVAPAVGRDEAEYRSALAQVQTGFTGPRTIVFVNPKGGASTTTSTLMAARTFGVHRGGGVVAWDNNETRGTLGSRGMPARHTNTARELLDNIGTFEDSASARIGDLGLYLRSQGAAHFDVLASDERAEVTGHIDSADVGRLHGLFQRFYRLVLIDTGNNMRAGNWLAAVHGADLVVVTTTIRQDSAEAALWMIDALERDVYGPGGLKPRAITVLAEPAPTYDPKLRATMMNIFGGRTRAVCPIPFDPGLVDGGVINYDRISQRSETAWLFACAAMASAL